MTKMIKGDKRPLEEQAKATVSQLETGYRRMIMRHAEELDRQQIKIKAAKAKLEAIQEKKNSPDLDKYMTEEERFEWMKAEGSYASKVEFFNLFQARAAVDGWTFTKQNGWVKK